MSDPMIVFDRVSKRYGSLPVLHDINLDVAAGEVISLIGPSGSGKSTLLRCVNHLERIEQGSITVDGELTSRASTSPLFRLRNENRGRWPPPPAASNRPLLRDSDHVE